MVQPPEPDDPAREPDDRPPAEALPPLVGPGWISGACVARAGQALYRPPYNGREGGDDDSPA